MKALKTLFLMSIALAAFAGCSSSSSEPACPERTLDIAVCAPTAGPFSLTIDNGFFPLVAGQKSVLEGDDDGDTIRLEILVMDQTETVAGVVTRVMEEREYENGELIEVSRNFFAQAPDGTVCYFGEDVDIYDNNQVVSHEGQWRAGVGSNQPGIYMPANPAPGMTFYQEYAPNLAQDISTIVSLGGTVTVPAGVFTDTLNAEDCNPLEGNERDNKDYVRNIGLAVDAEAQLISVEQLPLAMLLLP